MQNTKTEKKRRLTVKYGYHQSTFLLGPFRSSDLPGSVYKSISTAVERGSRTLRSALTSVDRHGQLVFVVHFGHGAKVRKTQRHLNVMQFGGLSEKERYRVVLCYTINVIFQICTYIYYYLDVYF